MFRVQVFILKACHNTSAMLANVFTQLFNNQTEIVAHYANRALNDNQRANNFFASALLRGFTFSGTSIVIYFLLRVCSCCEESGKYLEKHSSCSALLTSLGFFAGLASPALFGFDYVGNPDKTGEYLALEFFYSILAAVAAHGIFQIPRWCTEIKRRCTSTSNERRPLLRHFIMSSEIKSAGSAKVTPLEVVSNPYETIP